MGYMGFGMRKEVYMRKAKKVFVNWKHSKNKTDIKHEFKGHPRPVADNSTIRIYLKILLLVSILALIVLSFKYIFC
jgi:hypothetical protein